jgi:hypothetical protein
VLVFAITEGGAATTPDSIAYIEAARNIAAGNGLSLPTFTLSSDTDFRQMTEWPPAYPALIATAIGLPGGPEENVRALSAALFSILALLFFGYLIRETKIMSPWVALAGTIVALASGPVFSVYAYVWSETLFIPLIFLSFLLATNPARGRYRWRLVVATSAAVLAIYTRYIGVGLLPALVLSVVLSGQDRRVSLKEAMGVATGSALTIAPLLWRNLEISGFLGGVARTPAQASLAENADALQIQLTMHFGSYGAWQLIVLGGGAVAMAAALVSTRSAPDDDDGSTAEPDGFGLAHPLFWAAGYYGTLLFLASWKSFDPIDTRLVAPGVPFLVVSAVLLVAKVMGRQRLSRPTIAVVVAPILVWCGAHLVHGASVIERAQTQMSTKGAPQLEARPGAPYNNLSKHSLMKAFETAGDKLEASGVDTVFVDFARPLYVRHHTRARVKLLPSSREEADALLTALRQGRSAFLITQSTNLGVVRAHTSRAGIAWRLDRSLSQWGILLVLPSQPTPN